jgi:hypothetical protein
MTAISLRGHHQQKGMLQGRVRIDRGINKEGICKPLQRPDQSVVLWSGEDEEDYCASMRFRWMPPLPVVM